MAHFGAKLLTIALSALARTAPHGATVLSEWIVWAPFERGTCSLSRKSFGWVRLTVHKVALEGSL